jgi:hypothetical protein
MRNPAICNPALAGTLSDIAPIDPDMVVATVGPVTWGPDVSVAGGRFNDDSRSRWGNFDIDNGRLGQ